VCHTIGNDDRAKAALLHNNDKVTVVP
jgi:hypothetical protein